MTTPVSPFAWGTPASDYQFGLDPYQNGGFLPNGMNSDAFTAQQPVGTSTQPVGDTSLSNNGFFDNFSWTDGLNSVSNALGAYTGFQQLGIARQGLRDSRRQFNMNWDAQARLTNAQLEARRQRQISAQGINSGNGMTAQEYVDTYGVNR